MLGDHPWFDLTEVAASERSSGKAYSEAVSWHLDTPIPESARNLVVKGLDSLSRLHFVFSALDASVAGSAEEDFARAGYPVVSNSRNHRMDPDVPLLIPRSMQPTRCHSRPAEKSRLRHWLPRHNPNCSTAGLVLVLKPLADAFGLEKSSSSRSKPSPAPAILAFRDGYPGQRRSFHQRRRRKNGARAAEAPWQMGWLAFR